MSADAHPKTSLVDRRREKQRVKRERTGDSPERAAQRDANREDKAKNELPDPDNNVGKYIGMGGF